MHQRRIIAVLLILISVASIAVPGAAAQTTCDIGWSPPVRISPDSSVPTLPAIAVSGGIVHLVWYGLDTTAGGTLTRSGLCYSRSTDGGASFSEPLKLLSPSESLPGHLAALGDRVFITAGAFLDAFFGVVLFSSTDGGATWSGPSPVLAAAFPELLFARGDELFVGYREVESAAFGLLSSVDGGRTWRQLARRINGLSAMGAFGTRLFAAGATPGASQTEVGFYESPDSGTSWFGPSIISPEDLVRSSYPGIAVNPGGIISSAWTDTGTVVYRDSRNTGVSWGSWKRLSDEPGNVAAKIAAGGEFVAVAWDRNVGGTRGVRLRVSNDSGGTFCPIVSPDGSESAKEPALALTDSTLHMVWIDEPDGVGGLFYRRGNLPRAGPGNGDFPTSYALRQSYPNPTNGLAVIGFDVPAEAVVIVRIYNVLGVLLMTVAEGTYGRGHFEVPVEVGGMPSGIYFYRLTAPGFEGVGKMVVMR
jgi:hypothetical protein